MASILLDENTPTAETFSPAKEDQDPSKSKTAPPPKASDFVNLESDIYSERCTELLDNLESVTEETESDFKLEPPPVNSNANKTNVNIQTQKTNLSKNHINLKLTPLELKEDHIDLPKNQQKLTTPGKENNEILVSYYIRILTFFRARFVGMV